MSELRNRKIESNKSENIENSKKLESPKAKKSSKNENDDKKNDKIIRETIKSNKSTPSYINYLIIAVGVLMMIVSGYKYSSYIKLLHENYLWFSNIKEVEREISFRTEAGLYYSYYKELVLSNSLIDGIKSLVNDNRTECWRQINIFERFNIYQELILATIYKVFNLQAYYQRIYFYIDSIFYLHGVYIASLYCVTWVLSRSIFSSLLAVIFYVFNRQHSTRVDFSVPLRESFALPFIYIQILLICYHLRRKPNKNNERIIKFSIFVVTLVFCLFWQFSPFVLLLQSLAIFILYLTTVFSANDAIQLLLLNSCALITTCAIQFMNKMILSSFSLHFTYISIIIILLDQKFKRQYSVVSSIINTCILMIITCGFTLLLSLLSKKLLNIEADNHIYKFILSKFGYDKFLNDFETKLYLCHGGFEYLQTQIILDLAKTYLLQVYAIGQFFYLMLVCLKYIKTEILKTPTNGLQINKEVAFFSVQSICFGMLALSTTRMKYLWVPSTCVLSSVFLSELRVYESIFAKLKSVTTVEVVRNLVPIICIGFLYNTFWGNIKSELEDLREFYDPDTVELMEWINKNTDENATFAGSMQLLAGVKCCTGRRLTNHPHFEDRILRDVTKELYQMYALRTADKVYSILKKYNTDYIILEDSICLTIKENYCGLTQLLDIDNNHLIPPNENNKEEQITTKVKRFCDEIRYNNPSYTHYFKLMMINPTFRVYKLI